MTADSGDETPTFLASEPILALRTWCVFRDRLQSWTFVQQRWPVATPLVGTCLLADMPTPYPYYWCKHPFSTDRTAPHDPGSCGIHGIAIERIVSVKRDHSGLIFSTNQHSVTHFTNHFVVGIVALWGRVLLSENGIYRAERAYPLALFEADKSGPVAEAYGITVVPVPTSLDTLRTTFEQARSLLKEVPSHEPR